ncbi:MAG: P-loop NTPase [Micrococcaceae bacterium]
MNLPPHLQKTQQIEALNLNAKRIIAVTSGKGGVGKSTLTAHLALEATQAGYRVGIVDLDVFGFSIPALFNIKEKAERSGTKIKAVQSRGVYIVSMGMFVRSEDVVAWRGPLLHRTVKQLLSDVDFPELDYLFLDLPPGTGDIAISMGQLLPTAEVLIVTTPDINAADVAIRSGRLAEKNGQKVLGVLENMSCITMPDGSQQQLFGSGGGQKIAQELDVPLLAQLPLEHDISLKAHDSNFITTDILDPK